MKVIKEGKWNIVWTTEIACPVCAAQLLVEESDVKPVYNRMEYECACAACGKMLRIPSAQIAQRVREAADTNRKWSNNDL